MPTEEIKGVSVVFNGTFNPKIFQPAWFSSEKLLPQTEADSVTNLVVTQDFTTFSLPWLQVRVTGEQFSAMTTQESHFEPLRDLTIGAFKILRHTPVQQLGINAERHYRFESEAKWNKFGHDLAPKSVWHKFMNDPGLVQMTMIDKKSREGAWPALTRVDVQSSIRVKPGIYVMVNSHYECPSAEGLGALEAIKALEGNFIPALQYSERVFADVISIV